MFIRKVCMLIYGCELRVIAFPRRVCVDARRSALLVGRVACLARVRRRVHSLPQSRTEISLNNDFPREQ
jgi:hypothetical protein